jgi:predicted S18 family serine protease
VVVKEFFENELARQNAILESGYLFTAANEAFLDYIDLSTIVAMEAGDADLDDKVGEINGCFAGITRPEMTDTNFEWVVGADLRQNWAEDKLEATETENLLEEEKYVAYNELMYAQAWCEVAKGLVEAADTEGEVINEGIWKKIAEQKISDAKEMPVLDSELEDRLDIAEKAYNDGKYGAAIYDAAFVIAQSQQVPDEPDLSIVNESRTSLWGQVYQAHAVYFYFQNQTSAAYTTALLAKELDEATADMRDAINAQEITPQTTIQLDYYLLAAIGLMFLFIVAVGIIWRSHGNNGPRYRKTHRIGQKKG